MTLPEVLTAKVYRETPAWWVAHNPVLPLHSVGQESLVPFGAKVGDGSTPWNSLPYLGGGGGGGVRFVTGNFSFDTSGLTTPPGVSVATMQPGELLLWNSISLTELFNGTTPTLNIRVGDTDPYMGSAQTFAADDSADAPQGSELDIAHNNYVSDVYAPNASPPDVYIFLDDGAGGDPGSTQGHGRVGLLLLANAGAG